MYQVCHGTIGCFFGVEPPLLHGGEDQSHGSVNAASAGLRGAPLCVPLFVSS